MAIARYENITVNRVSNSVDAYGQQTTSLSKWFDTRARVQDVHNNTQITKETRCDSFVHGVQPINQANVHCHRRSSENWACGFASLKPSCYAFPVV